jgi:hypothetical protein
MRRGEAVSADFSVWPILGPPLTAAFAASATARARRARSGAMASKGEAASPAGSSAILAALASSAFAAGATLFVSELLRVSSQELRERVFTPRVTRRLEHKRGEEVRAAWDFSRRLFRLRDAPAPRPPARRVPSPCRLL